MYKCCIIFLKRFKKFFSIFWLIYTLIKWSLFMNTGYHNNSRVKHNRFYHNIYPFKITILSQSCFNQFKNHYTYIVSACKCCAQSLYGTIKNKNSNYTICPEFQVFQQHLYKTYMNQWAVSSNIVHFHCLTITRDVDPDWMYPDPVRIKVNKITKLISNHLLKAKKTFYSLSMNLNLRDKLSSGECRRWCPRVQTWKIKFLVKKKIFVA